MQMVGPTGNSSSKPGRNEACVCGSGKKYKKCCGPQEQEAARAEPGRAVSPADIQQLLGQYSAGRHTQLQSRARELLARDGQAGAVWKLLGVSLWAQGKDALVALEQAVRWL